MVVQGQAACPFPRVNAWGRGRLGVRLGGPASSAAEVAGAPLGGRVGGRGGESKASSARGGELPADAKGRARVCIEGDRAQGPAGCGLKTRRRRGVGTMQSG